MHKKLYCIYFFHNYKCNYESIRPLLRKTHFSIGQERQKDGAVWHRLNLYFVGTGVLDCPFLYKHCPIPLILYLPFQVRGERRISIGKTSRRPISISRVKTIFDSTENEAKLPVGPTTSRPGPILLSVAATAVKLVVKLLPSRLTKSTDTAKIIR